MTNSTKASLLLALILVVAGAWRLLLWAQPLHYPANDELEYIQVARDLVAGRGWSFYESWRWLRAPLYPLWLAASLWWADGDLHRAALPNLALSLLLVLLIYRLARELSPTASRRPALIAAALAAILQTYATFASLYMSETLFSTLFTAGLLCLAAWRRRGGLGLIILAGLCFGLACLTRSAAQIFLPLVALWLIWWRVRQIQSKKLTETAMNWRWSAGFSRLKPALQRVPRRVEQFGATFQTASKALVPIFMPALVLMLTVVVVIAPWSLRNCRAYGACILIETGGAYNLWAFYEPRESLDEIHQILEAIPNPVDRASEARMRGMERLREDPLMLLRRIPDQWNNLWLVKPIQDRFLLPNDYSDPPPILFITALILDDLLYLLILAAAPFGLLLALQRRDGFALLLALWVVAFCAAGVLTHTEGRYRHFFFMILIALAGLAYDTLLRRVRWSPLPVLLSLALLLPALLPAIYYYPWDWMQRGVVRSIQRELGDRHAAAGRTEQAAQAYYAAVAADPTPDGWLALGNLARRNGNLTAAERYYRFAYTERPPYVASSALLGDLLREQGRDEEARFAFRGTYLREQQMIDWSYLMLTPAPRSYVDVGNGLDLGYLGGFYPAEVLDEVTSRWSSGRASLRLSAPASVPKADRLILQMHIAAPRPDATPVPLEVCRAAHCTKITLEASWRTVSMLIPNEGDTITLRSPTFSAPDRRDLGVILDWARLIPMYP
ncbi:tetratricopeptide repeat protein [Candidatus Viridilinea mediisalina]|uniref:Glycosyltransferase RgtA/B/C/D-like domain-containing protein n=1 Tax=Candidatus Viridilinea mediisalina TaxID=2024553 RepID=A0A2A6RMH6_9CHLR|nr:tetratricopeptide repeat protein [Candidatus Viridilinea mediisalina]PDW04143.1 hypothetical protein CJ255_04745 [Candidatus Viridilinea mediisalina]